MKFLPIVVIMTVFLLLFVGCGTEEGVEEEQQSEIVSESLPPIAQELPPASEDTPSVKESSSTPEQMSAATDVAPQPRTLDEMESLPAPLKTTTVVEEKVVIRSPELRDLLSRADQKVKSYKYLYSLSQDNRVPHTYFVKENFIKIKLFEVDPYMIENYYDTVYINAKTKKAQGYCESKSRCILRDIDNTKKVFSVSYPEYRTKTPYEFLKDIGENAEIVGPELIENRQSVKVRQVTGDIITEFWLDATYGMPRRIRVIQEDNVLKTYNFADMTFNALKDEDVKR